MFWMDILWVSDISETQRNLLQKMLPLWKVPKNLTTTPPTTTAPYLFFRGYRHRYSGLWSPVVFPSTIPTEENLIFVKLSLS